MDVVEPYELLKTLNNSGIDLVAYVVERDFKNALQYVEKDDLVGYGVFGLLKAAKQYDASKGVSFPTFACKKVRNAIFSFIRQKCQRKYKYIEEIEMVQVTNQNPHEAYEAEDERAYVRRAVDGLPEPHRGFVDRYYLHEMSVKEMLKTTGIKRHRIFQLRAQSLALLRIQMR